MKNTIVFLTLISFLVSGYRLAAKTPVDTLSEKGTIHLTKKKRGLISMSNTFVPKGQWIAGTSASFSTHTNDNYTFVVVEGINSIGHTVKVTPILAYALKKNMAIGARFTYSRTFLKVDGAKIKLGDEDTGINLSVDSYYALKHSYEGAGIGRQ